MDIVGQLLTIVKELQKNKGLLLLAWKVIVKLSQIIFRFTCLALVLLYLLVMANILSPGTFSIDFNLRYDVVGLSVIVVAYIFIFLRKPQ